MAEPPSGPPETTSGATAAEPGPPAAPGDPLGRRPVVRPGAFLRRRLTRTSWSIALLLTVVGSWFGWMQGPRPDPFRAPTLTERFLYPIERNAIRRLPTIGASLNSVTVSSDGRTLWAVGDGGTVVKSGDGGETWTDPLRPYARWPAPWYAVVLLSALLLIALPWIVPDRRPATDKVQRILDTAVPDSPVSTRDGDRLGFAPLVDALSGFLRNENTRAPLVLAITAPWGQGKSGIMGMLRADLAARGGATIWFNAWHHQKEEHLLASLLSAIRAAAVPAWWRWRGMQVRWTLYRARIVKHPVATLLAAAAVFVPLGLMIAYGFGAAPTVDKWVEWIKPAPAKVATPPSEIRTGTVEFGPTGIWIKPPIGEPKPPPPESKADAWDHAVGAARWLGAQADWLKWLPTLVGLVFSLRLGRDRLKDAGLDPAKLMATLSSDTKVKDLDAQLSFRHRFAREFRETTDALGTRTLTIFIDDLDRCRPEAVGEILEAVNFLVSSGDCFIVLGYYREHVERAVGLHFKDIAGELRPGDAAAGAPDDDKDSRAREERRRYAQHYLQKLVQIEVPVPRLADGAGAALLPQAPAEPQAADAQPRTKNALEQLSVWFGAYWKACGFATICALAILGLVGLGIGGGHWLPDPPKLDASKSAPTAPSTSTGVPKPPPDPGDPGSRPADPDRRSDAPLFREGQTAPFPWALFVASLLVLALAYLYLAVQLQRREDRRYTERDSDDFIDAIRIWAPLLQGCLATPRELKRFVNEVRFYAARSQATPASTGLRASEPAVVALASLRTLDQHVRRAVGDHLPSAPLHTLNATARIERFGTMYAAIRDRTPPPEELLRLVSIASTTLGGTPPIADEDRSAFSLWSEGVRA